MDEKLDSLNDPLGLISQSLDGVLSASDKNRLDQELAGSEALKAEQQKMRDLDNLIRRWGSNSVELDWENFSALILARIETKDEEWRCTARWRLGQPLCSRGGKCMHAKDDGTLCGVTPDEWGDHRWTCKSSGNVMFIHEGIVRVLVRAARAACMHTSVE